MKNFFQAILRVLYWTYIAVEFPILVAVGFFIRKITPPEDTPLPSILMLFGVALVLAFFIFADSRKHMKAMLLSGVWLLVPFALLFGGAIAEMHNMVVNYPWTHEEKGLAACLFFAAVFLTQGQIIPLFIFFLGSFFYFGVYVRIVYDHHYYHTKTQEKDGRVSWVGYENLDVPDIIGELYSITFKKLQKT